MRKTIEKLAREYVKDVYSGDTDFIDEAENILSWLFNKPIASRLTDVEKEYVREEYAKTQNILNKETDYTEYAIICGAYMQTYLENLLGIDFFKA